MNSPPDRRVPELLTADEVAQLLRVSARTVRRWGVDGHLPRVELGDRLTRYRADDVSAFIRPMNAIEPAATNSGLDQKEKPRASHTPHLEQRSAA